MLQSIIGVLFGTNNKIKIQLDKSNYYTGDEVTKIPVILSLLFRYRLLGQFCLRLMNQLNIMRLP